MCITLPRFYKWRNTPCHWTYKWVQIYKTRWFQFWQTSDLPRGLGRCPIFSYRTIQEADVWFNTCLQHRRIPTFDNGCLSAIGGGKQRPRLAGWVQLSGVAAPGPHGVPPWPPGQGEYRWCGKFTWIAALWQHFIFFCKSILIPTVFW